MNLLRLIPSRFRESYERNLQNAGIENAGKYFLKKIFLSLFLSLLISIAFFYLKLNPLASFILLFVIMQTIFYFRISLKASSRIRKMEDVVPDFLQLVASNLRAGITLDKAFLSSVRPEFSPLDEEIMKTGGEIATGKEIILALRDMAKKINSERIEKTTSLIISGLKEGGNISALLESTASNMREKEFLEKKATSNVLMYIIFISVAVGFGAPVLFGLSSILIEVIIKLTSQLPAAHASQIDLPFTLSAISLSPEFVIYFSLIFLIATDFVSCLVIGLVNKGNEKYGLKYVFPLVVLSVSVFFLIRIFLSKILVRTFAIVS